MSASLYPDFASIVERMVQSVEKEKLEELRRDFHARLRITLTQPDRTDLVEDLWDFFYDWCLFEQKIPDSVAQFPGPLRATWDQVKEGNLRGLYSVQKVDEDTLKLKELYTGKSVIVGRRLSSDFLGIQKGDILEGRLIEAGAAETEKTFVRKPSFHPVEVHSYIKQKVKQFKKSGDFDTYQAWLWLLVGMYLKHRIYQHMPIEKIYDDNSRI